MRHRPPFGRFRRWFWAIFALSALSLPARAQAPDPIAQAAGVYAAYRADIALLSQAPLSAPGDVERALDTLARYKDDDLVHGWIAYGGMSAARSPAYAAGIASVEKRYGRAAVLKALISDSAYPSRRRGYADGIAALLDRAAADHAAARATAAHLDAVAEKPIAWSETQSGDSRAAALRNAPSAPNIPPALVLAPRNPALRLAPAKALLARRMATLGAMQILGSRDAKPIARLLEDKPTRECVHMQRLQFLQCVSVTHDAGEAAQCLSEHALRGVNKCLGGGMTR